MGLLVLWMSVLKPYMAWQLAWRLRVTRRLTRSMVWQRRRDSGLGNGSGERRWCGPSSDGDEREVTTPTHVRPYMHMPVSLHDGPPHEYYHPIHLLQHRYALLLNNYGQYTSVFTVPHHQRHALD
ncbi:hypothetical protein M422DRAFT_255299 [Sphaerobolus stellatus SS14]|uniref:Secreted protein n=1 Tax=Sphaerobolus stellatus (strain SS14) TaxID=990650 RepID=A0A0C9V443_SPHS4|nr:hypothetical protein M422DRAFT_255299 [Sphaerobolus stellatus SS14]